MPIRSPRRSSAARPTIHVPPYATAVLGEPRTPARLRAVPAGELVLAARCLDGGALGVFVSHVDTVADAEEAVHALRFPPLGHRSAGGNYPLRRQLVKSCVVLNRDNLDEVLAWMPQTCAYRLLHEGKRLEDWHPLISGDQQSVHRAGMSVRGWTVSEVTVTEDDWEDYILEDGL